MLRALGVGLAVAGLAASGCSLFAGFDGLSGGEDPPAPGQPDGGAVSVSDATAPDVTSTDAGPQDPSSASLVGYWAFDEGGGTTARDSSPKGNHGVLRNGPTWTSDGKRGGALAFDGAQQHVEVLTLQNESFPVSGTLSLWLRAPFADVANRPIFDGYADDRDHLYIRQTSAGPAKVQFAAQAAAGSAAVASVDVSASTWVHLVMAWDTQARRLTVYVDGVLAAERALPTGWAPRGQRVNFAHADCCGAIQGTLDEIRLYDRALSAEEIAAIP